MLHSSAEFVMLCKSHLEERVYGKVGGRSEELSSHRDQQGARTHRYYFPSTRPERELQGIEDFTHIWRVL